MPPIYSSPVTQEEAEPESRYDEIAGPYATWWGPVIAPAAVVGNWAAEAARFAPGLRVLVHHGAARASDSQLEKEIAEADVIVTTYATAVRDIDALASAVWTTIVLEREQKTWKVAAIRNMMPTNTGGRGDQK